MRVLILTSSTGGGHNTRAKAFAAWAKKEADLNLEVIIHQTLENTHGLYHLGVELYNWIQRTAPVLHHIYFNFLEHAALFKKQDKLLGVSKFREVLREHQPDIILSVHGSLNHGFFEVARETLHTRPPRCVTYCGELFGGYGFSRHWVNPHADLFIGAVPETAAMARRLDMPEDRTTVGGFLLDPSFSAPRLGELEKKDILAEQFDLDPYRPTLLLTNNHLTLLNTLKNSGLRPQIIAICGKSTPMWQSLSAWAAGNPSIPLRPIYFTRQIAELLQCVTAVIARPGTGTTSEAILSHCPILFNGLGGIMPQERITVKFAAQHGFAHVIRRPEDFPKLLRPLLDSPDMLTDIRRNMAQAFPVGTPRQILESVIGRHSLPTFA
jgi:processive 1,2-diacylglycerol beta-glucosyltransferase